MPEVPFDLEDRDTPEGIDFDRSVRRQRQAKSAWWSWFPYVGGVLASLVTTVLVVVVVLEVNTGKTTLQLEIDEPGATVYLDGQKWEGEVPGGLQPVFLPIREGRHEIRVEKTGFRRQTRDFEYRQGGIRPIIQIRLAPPKPRARPGK